MQLRKLTNPRFVFSKIIDRVDPRDPHPWNHWSRRYAYGQIDEFVGKLQTTSLSALEISGDELINRYKWGDKTKYTFPQVDLCNPSSIPATKFDVVFCSEVLEHTKNPIIAMKSIAQLLKPDGVAVVTTPFLLRVHEAPGDYWRFTPEGLKVLVESSGLECIDHGSWGNTSCVRANFYRWAFKLPWHSMKNEPDFPVIVWAFCGTQNCSTSRK